MFNIQNVNRNETQFTYEFNITLKFKMIEHQTNMMFVGVQYIFIYEFQHSLESRKKLWIDRKAEKAAYF